MSESSIQPVAGGNGRLYRIGQEDAEKEKRRRQEQLDSNPQGWMNSAWVESGPVYNGYIQITQDVLDWIQEAFDAQDEEHMRLNINGAIAEGGTQGKYLKLEGAWIAKHVSLKQHRQDADKREVVREKKAASTDAPPRNKQAQYDEADIPF